MPSLTVSEKKSLTTPQVKNWVTIITAENNLSLQGKIIAFLLWAYGGLLLVTMGIFLLQGFHAWGFALESKLLAWLGASTVGEIGGLLMLSFRVVFGQTRGHDPKTTSL